MGLTHHFVAYILVKVYYVMWIGILVRNATYVHILLILPTLYFDRVPVPYVSMTQYIYQANAIGVGISKLNFFQKNKMDGVSIQKVSK